MSTKTDTVNKSNKWSNWNRVVCCHPKRIVRATTTAEVQQAVKDASVANLNLRVAGAGHSFGPVVATDDVLLNLRLDGDIKIYDSRVCVPAGFKLHEVFDPLWEHNLSLVNIGELDTTTLTGAIGTGVHGTGLELPSISACLKAAQLVTASGDAIELESGTELMCAARVSMGMLGIMCETTIDLVPAYDLVEKCYFLTVEQTLEEWDQVLSGNRHYNFYYLPNRQASATYSDIFPPVPEGIDGEICFTQIRNAQTPGESFSNDVLLERRDRMNRILTYTYPDSYREIEFAIPLDEAKTVFRKIRSRLQGYHPTYAHPIDVRFVAQDDALLSWCHDGPKAIFSVPDSQNCNYDSVLADLEELFYRYGGLPHWGKEHRLTRQRLQSLQPGFNQFVEIRRELDPKGVFLNDHLESLFK